jgi:hypothetical protein
MIVLFWISKQAGHYKKKDEGILIRPRLGIDKESILEFLL